MAHARMIDAYVRDLLDGAFGDRVEVEGRTYRLPVEARPVVEVAPAAGNALRVIVAAPVAYDVAPTPELFEALNAINAELPYGRLFLTRDRVWVEDTVLGESLDWPQLDNSIHFVSWASATHGDRIAAAGGGNPVVTEDADERPGGDLGTRPRPRQHRRPARPRRPSNGDLHGIGPGRPDPRRSQRRGLPVIGATVSTATTLCRSDLQAPRALLDEAEARLRRWDTPLEAAILAVVDRRFTYDVPTMAVRLRADGLTTLLVNPDFVLDVGVDGVAFVPSNARCPCAASVTSACRCRSATRSPASGTSRCWSSTSFSRPTRTTATSCPRRVLPG